jgi:lipoyl(octanoyl) transferase
MMGDWRLIRTPAATGAWNMAVDEALLEAVAAGTSPPVLRLYRWQPAAVSLGYGQRGPEQVNLAACHRYGIDVVRRMTGGRAVLHDREMTYAVVAPHKGGVFPGGILENYRVIAQPLLALFRKLGIEGQLVPGKQRFGSRTQDSSVCFTMPSSYEIVYAGHKLTGGAQKHQGTAFLQHGSVPLELNLDTLWAVLHPDDSAHRAAGVRHLKKNVGWINRWCRPPLDVEALESLFIETFADILNLRLIADEITAEEEFRTQQLMAERYLLDAWNH